MTHVALGQVRVMRNTGTVGEAIGLTAAARRTDDHPLAGSQRTEHGVVRPSANVKKI